MLLRYRVHRVVVADGDNVLGVLEALDLFSFLSNHSHLITVQIDTAKDLPTLTQAASKITRMMQLMHRSGTRVTLIAKLVQELNARLFERAWQLIASPDLVANSCLFVMGSEGRGEQLLKTDQDNGLILKDGYQPADDLAQVCQRFSDTLAEFGYPMCPGNIMLSNPQWRNSLSEFGQMTRQWLLIPSPDSLMNLAIFMDAHAVCGDAQLLEKLRDGIMNLATDNDAMLARFASAIDSFGSSQGWWNRLLLRGDGEQVLNLKKEGVFALVHGVRSMALECHLRETGTIERIHALVKLGTLSAEVGDEISEALQFLMGLKLKVGLLEVEMDRPVSGSVELAKLSSLDRDLLKDALSSVKRFKGLLRHRFKLDAL
jgi:CBS domain-containing protein